MESLNRADILADRVRQRLSGRDVIARRMFGGVALMSNGNMLCCAGAKGLMVRVGAAQEAEALSRPHAQPCLGTGRRMPGFVIVAPEGVAGDEDLTAWVDLALAYVDGLPNKVGKRPALKRGG